MDQDSILEHKKTSEEAFQARCRMASREQQKVFATSGGAAAISIPQSGWMPIGSTTDTGEVSNISSPMRRTLTAALIAVLIVGGGFFVHSRIFGTTALTSSDEITHMYAAVGNVIDSISNGFGKLVASLRGTPRSSTSISQVTPSSGTSFELNGMAVVPEYAKDEFTKEQIKSSFSDPVRITPDQGGTSGVITPAFRETAGDEFMYVLVPVKDADNKAQSTTP